MQDIMEQDTDSLICFIFNICTLRIKVYKGHGDELYNWHDAKWDVQKYEHCVLAMNNIKVYKHVK